MYVFHLLSTSLFLTFSLTDCVRSYQKVCAQGYRVERGRTVGSGMLDVVFELHSLHGCVDPQLYA